jgi:hypothetical protein
MNFVDHNQSAQIVQGNHWLVQPALTGQVFQVKIVERIGWNQLPGNCGFSGLARADQRHNPAATEGGTDGGKERVSPDHGGIIP